MEDTTVTGRLGLHPLREATKPCRDFTVDMFNNNCSKITTCRRICSRERRDSSTILISHSGIFNFFTTESLADWKNRGKVAGSSQTCSGQLLSAGSARLPWSHWHSAIPLPALQQHHSLGLIAAVWKRGCFP